LKCTNDSQIQELVNQMDIESKQIKEDLLKLIWYMRGSVSYSEACAMSIHEREVINKIIKDNLETTRKSKLPFF